MTLAPQAPANPFAQPSHLPCGLPPFDRIHEEDYRPAFEQGMAEHRAEVARIADDESPATIENTLDALERSGAVLSRVLYVFENLTAASSTPGLRDLETEMAPRLAAHRDAVLMDPGIWRRVADLREAQSAGHLELDVERARLLQRYHDDMMRAGAALGADDQARLRELNGQLASGEADFDNRLRAAANAAAVHVTERARLAGLSDDRIAGAEAEARSRGLAQGWLLTLDLPTQQPELASLHDRSLREELYRASSTRGLHPEHDTRAVLTRIAQLRAQRAALLGYPDHASFAVADETAQTVEALDEMLARLVGPAVANARDEAAELEAALVADGQQAPLQPWDWAYYAEQVRRERLSVDDEGLRPYLELDRVLREGLFAAAHSLYGLVFRERHDLPTYHPDVRVFDVSGAGGTGEGLFLLDPFARESKRGGAWMNLFAEQSRLLDQQPVTTTVWNVPRPADGEPALMTTDEVRTAFHEFGHVLHGLLSDVRYPRFSGPNVPTDFVEFPSQVNEMWAWDPAVIGRYAVHHSTGEPLPAAALAGLAATRSYGQGFTTTEYLGATLLDQAWHRLRADDVAVAPEDVEEFEAKALRKAGFDVPQVPPRYRSSYFAHSFGSGYSARYYGYIWSEVLDADTVDWFTENGGLRRENGEVFARELLARGGSVDPMEAFAAVRGRGPDVTPLLRRRGLLPAGA